MKKILLLSVITALLVGTLQAQAEYCNISKPWTCDNVIASQKKYNTPEEYSEFISTQNVTCVQANQTETIDYTQYDYSYGYLGYEVNNGVTTHWCSKTTKKTALARPQIVIQATSSPIIVLTPQIVPVIAQIATSSPQVLQSVPNATSTPKLTKKLKYGQRGGQVSILQQLLGIEDSGYFGKQTLKAVKKFQRLNGLSQTGLVGDGTMSKLNQ